MERRSSGRCDGRKYGNAVFKYYGSGVKFGKFKLTCGGIMSHPLNSPRQKRPNKASRKRQCTSHDFTT